MKLLRIPMQALRTCPFGNDTQSQNLFLKGYRWTQPARLHQDFLELNNPAHSSSLHHKGYTRFYFVPRQINSFHPQ